MRGCGNGHFCGHHLLYPAAPFTHEETKAQGCVPGYQNQGQTGPGSWATHGIHEGPTCPHERLMAAVDL